MTHIEVKTNEHLFVLDLMRNLFQSSIEQDEIDPDVFMESCFMFVLAYHTEFSDLDVVDGLVARVKSSIQERCSASADVELRPNDDEPICH